MANEPGRNPGQGGGQQGQGGGQQGQGGYGGSQMPGRKSQDEQAAADMGKREGIGAQGDAADRSEVDRPDLNNQDVE